MTFTFTKQRVKAKEKKNNTDEKIQFLNLKRISGEKIVIPSFNQNKKDSKLIVNKEKSQIESKEDETSLTDIKNYTDNLLSQLESKGKLIVNAQKHKNRKLKKKNKKKKEKSRKLFFGGKSEDELHHEIGLAESTYAVGFICLKMERRNNLEMKRVKGLMEIFHEKVDVLADLYFSKMNHEEMNLLTDLTGEEHEHDHTEEMEEHQELLDGLHEREKEVEDEHKALMHEEQEKLDEQQEKLDQEEEMIDHLKEDEHSEESEDQMAENINLISQQMSVLQRQMAGLQEELEENEKNRVSLLEKVNKVLPADAQITNSAEIGAEDQEMKDKEDQYTRNKENIENKIELVKQQMNSMQNQLNLINQKRQKEKDQEEIRAILKKT